MLPEGCVQIPINGLSRAIKQTGIDAAPAMVGWDFSGEKGIFLCKEEKNMRKQAT